MDTNIEALKTHSPKHDFFIGIDSDGCVFDSMEIKHKECFCPEFVLHFNLQRVARAARETWEFVNLYSRSRGANRFLAVLKALDLLRERPDIKKRGGEIPRLEGLRNWVQREKHLSNNSLQRELARTGDADLELVWTWSNAVNKAVSRIVKDVPPFTAAREVLQVARAKADLMVVSQTPGEALHREWQEHGIKNCVHLIAGQELGTKTEILTLATKGKYPAERTLMIGDSPGDLVGAQKTGTLFFPIIPGKEEHSWERLRDEGLERLYSGQYAGDYEAQLIQEFNNSLPEQPAWTT